MERKGGANTTAELRFSEWRAVGKLIKEQPNKQLESEYLESFSVECQHFLRNILMYSLKEIVGFWYKTCINYTTRGILTTLNA